MADRRIGAFTPEQSQAIWDAIQKLTRAGYLQPRRGPKRDAQFTNWIVKTDSSGVTARSGDTMGTGNGSPYYIDDDDELIEIKDSNNESISMPLYNLAVETVAADTYVQAKVVFGRAVVDWEECV